MISIYIHTTTNFPCLPILKKSSFFSKNFFFQKTKISYVFDEPDYSIRILRQIRYNLLPKSFEMANHAFFVRESINWQVSMKKHTWRD